MSKLITNFQAGTLTSGITNVATSISSAEFATLPVVAAPDTLALVLDPGKVDGEPEIVTVTAHTTSATTVTATRGAESTTNRAHASAIEWVLAATADDHTHAQESTLTYSKAGELFTGTGTFRHYFQFPATIIEVEASVGTAPTGASVIVDLNLNGTTVWSTQANRTTIVASAFVATQTTFNSTAIVDGDYLTVDVDQVGSTVSGSDLLVVVRYRRDG